MPAPDPLAVRDLANALARYAAVIDRGTSFRPAGAAAARAYFGSIPSAEGRADGWEWAAAVAWWPEWRPHRLERRLVLPAADELAAAADACRGWSPERAGWLPRLAKGGAPDPLRGLLTAAADLLDAVRRPDPRAVEAVAALVPLGGEIEHALGRLGDGWTPARLAALAAALAAPARETPFPVAGGRWGPVLAAAGVALGGSDPAACRWWAEWLGASGADWFHGLASLAVESPEARAWLAACRAELGVGCYPEAPADGGPPVWPVGAAAHPPGITFASGGANDPGIRTVERFATAPEAARFTVDVGVPSHAAAVAWARLGDPARERLARALGRALRTGEAPSGEEVLAVLDGAGDAAGALAAVRTWAETGGWTVVAGADGDGTAVARPVFKHDAPAGALVRVKSYGLAGPDGVVRPAEVVVSAGPPPAGLTELEAAATGAPGIPGEELRAALRDLRAAGAGGYLELAAVELHRLFWDRVRPAWDGPPSDGCAAALAAMLREAFGLTPLVPAAYRDHPPDWVTVPPGTRMVTGRVTRVVRPGLTAGGALRLPAVVEAE